MFFNYIYAGSREVYVADILHFALRLPRQAFVPTGRASARVKTQWYVGCYRTASKYQRFYTVPYGIKCLPGQPQCKMHRFIYGRKGKNMLEYKRKKLLSVCQKSKQRKDWQK